MKGFLLNLIPKPQEIGSNYQCYLYKILALPFIELKHVKKTFSPKYGENGCQVSFLHVHLKNIQSYKDIKLACHTSVGITGVALTTTTRIIVIMAKLSVNCSEKANQLNFPKNHLLLCVFINTRCHNAFIYGQRVDFSHASLLFFKLMLTEIANPFCTRTGLSKQGINELTGWIDILIGDIGNKLQLDAANNYLRQSIGVKKSWI